MKNDSSSSEQPQFQADFKPGSDDKAVDQGMEEKPREENRPFIMPYYGTSLIEMDSRAGMETNGCLQKIEGNKGSEHNLQGIIS